MPEAFDVFLSYNRKDQELARRLRKELEDRGVEVWMDDRRLRRGQAWIQEIEEALQIAPAAIIVIGPSGIGDSWQDQERQACLVQRAKRNIPVLSVLLPGCPEPDTLPPFLETLTWGGDLRSGFDGEELNRLVSALGKDPSPQTSDPPPGSPPRLHNLPFLPLGSLFQGREEDLKALEASLQSGSQATAIVQPHAIHGLGGIGKTRLAVEHAWRSGHRYDTALFVIAESPEALSANLASLASVLAIPERQSPVQEEVVAGVLGWLRDHSRWLLILDNIDTPAAQEAILPLLPRLGRGNVLITSRRSDWPAVVQEQPIAKLSQEEATRFLLQRTEKRRARREDDPSRAAELARILDGLPLALEHAGAYIIHHQMSFAEYLESWEQEKEEVVSWYDKSVMQYPASMAVTWQTTFLQLGPTAKAILRLAAHLAPDPIPSEIFVKGTARVEQAVALLSTETGEDVGKQTVKSALAELATYSMITRQDETFVVHRMVQEVLRSRIPEAQRRGWIEIALQLVDEVLIGNPKDTQTWPAWAVLRPHVTEIVQRADQMGIAEATARLMSKLGEYLYRRGLYTETEPILRRALHLAEVALGQHHPEFTVFLSNLAMLLYVSREFSEAELLMRRALDLDEERFGSFHPKVATDLNDLALLLSVTNRRPEAVAMIQRALEIDEKIRGSNHEDVARDLLNLAVFIQKMGRFSEAESLMRRALAIDEVLFGSEHQEVAIDLSRLASVLKETNRLSEAELMMRQALRIFERTLGPDHPRTKDARTDLAELQREAAENPSHSTGDSALA